MSKVALVLLAIAFGSAITMLFDQPMASASGEVSRQELVQAFHERDNALVALAERIRALEIKVK